MKKSLFFACLFLFSLAMQHCQSPEKARSGKAIFSNETFILYADRVEQGESVAKALSSTRLTSDYQSPASTTYSSIMTFKFALNGRDNEMPIGVDHKVWVQPEANAFTTPIITFGKQYSDEVSEAEAGYLPANTTVTLRLDLSPVLSAFKENGVFTDINGNKLYEQDFKGVFVAGSSAPLSWDFENLPSRPQFQLKDEEGDGIYTLDLMLNSHNPDDFVSNAWSLSKDISKYPVFTSDLPLLDALYTLSLEEMLLDIRPDNTFMAGAKWNGVWTRDISYSILLSMALLEPEVAKNSLLRKVKNGRIVQDTGTGGSWPVSTDRMTWALAAWEVYLQTGDRNWLAQSYRIIKKSAEDDLKTVFFPKTKLAMGESSFLDWRKQSYPRWMQPIDIYVSQCLGTNAVHFRTYEILSQMGNRLGEDVTLFKAKAAEIKAGINKHLWLDDEGYYAQFLYGKNHLLASPRSEALGEALSILFGIADAEKATSIAQKTPVVEYGVPCIYPQIPNVPPYHNNGIWPFVQAYWNWSMAKAGNGAALEHGLANLYRAAALFLTNKENMVAETGDFKGTEINSDRQLWSVAGNLAMVYRVFLGMELTESGIRFSPTIPKAYNGTFTVSGYNYRDATLDITVKGYGNSIAEFKVDGQLLEDPVFTANTAGNHQIEIVLSNQALPQSKFNLVENRFSLPTPQLKKHDNKLVWEAVKAASEYHIYQNGKKIASTEQTAYELPAPSVATEYTIVAVNASNYSFASEPVLVWGEAEVIEVEKFGSTLKEAKGFLGKGYVALSQRENTDFKFKARIKEEGVYWLMLRYANGSGPINTDNKCAIRSLFVEDALAGVVVMPQRGSDEWSNWGWSNTVKVKLEKGKNEFRLRLLPHNENMNGAVNRAFVDQVLLVKAE